MVEHSAVNRRVASSSLARGATQRNPDFQGFFMNQMNPRTLNDILYLFLFIIMNFSQQ